MKLFCIIIVSLFITACDFPKRGSQVSYTSYTDAYEVASRECQSGPQFANESLYDCLKAMDFQENVYTQDFDSVTNSESVE